MPYRPYPNVARALRQLQRHAQPEPAGTYVLTTRPVTHIGPEYGHTADANLDMWLRPPSPGRVVLPGGVSVPVEQRIMRAAEAIRRGMMRSLNGRAW